MGKSKAEGVQEWLQGWQGLDGAVKLNATVTRPGESSVLVQATDRALRRYVDGTEVRRYTFAVVVMADWSPGQDSINAEAMRLAEDWQEWTAAQWPGNVPEGFGEVLGIEPVESAPVLVGVYEENGVAEYQFTASITYETR